MRIVTAANETYARPLGVLLNSLGETTDNGEVIDVTVLTTGLDAAWNKIVSCACGRLNVKKHLVKSGQIASLKVSGHVSHETYFRLLMETELPKEKRVLYLDSDILVRRSLKKLWESDLEGLPLAAAPNVCRRSGLFGGDRGVPSHTVRGISKETRTFNAGVMLIDLDHWRRDEVSKHVLEYLHSYENLVLWWDQDGLNSILHDKWKRLSPEWNFMTSHFGHFKGWEETLIEEAEFKAVQVDPAIVHFTSENKPWKSDYKSIYGDEYRERLREVDRIFGGKS